MRCTVEDVENQDENFAHSTDENVGGRNRPATPNGPDGMPSHCSVHSSTTPSTSSRCGTPQPWTPHNIPLSIRQQLALIKQLEQTPDGPISPHSPCSSASRGRVAKIHRTNARGETRLHLAARKGDVKLCEQLIREGAIVNAKDYAGWTPLHEACNKGRYDAARVLVSHGADLTATSTEDGTTPLHDAATSGNVQLVRFLLRSGASRKATNRWKQKPIDLCGMDPEIRATLEDEDDDDEDALAIVEEESASLEMNMQHSSLRTSPTMSFSGASTPPPLEPSTARSVDDVRAEELVEQVESVNEERAEDAQSADEGIEDENEMDEDEEEGGSTEVEEEVSEGSQEEEEKPLPEGAEIYDFKDEDGDSQIIPPLRLSVGRSEIDSDGAQLNDQEETSQEPQVLKSEGPKKEKVSHHKKISPHEEQRMTRSRVRQTGKVIEVEDFLDWKRRKEEVRDRPQEEFIPGPSHQLLYMPTFEASYRLKGMIEDKWDHILRDRAPLVEPAIGADEFDLGIDLEPEEPIPMTYTTSPELYLLLERQRQERNSFLEEAKREKKRLQEFVCEEKVRIANRKHALSLGERPSYNDLTVIKILQEENICNPQFLDQPKRRRQPIDQDKIEAELKKLVTKKYKHLVTAAEELFKSQVAQYEEYVRRTHERVDRRLVPTPVLRLRFRPFRFYL